MTSVYTTLCKNGERFFSLLAASDKASANTGRGAASASRSASMHKCTAIAASRLNSKQRGESMSPISSDSAELYCVEVMAYVSSLFGALPWFLLQTSSIWYLAHTPEQPPRY